MDDDQQFCLRWNNHQTTLISVFDTLLEKGMHVDCSLAAEGKTLKAHKVVLSACSPYFESVLSQQYDKHPIIILKDVKYAELRAMMDYMYRGEVNISQDQLAALLKAAESLQIKGLSDNKPPRPSSPSVKSKINESVSTLHSREGSSSPVPRKRKKPRRASADILNHNTHTEPSPTHTPAIPVQTHNHTPLALPLAHPHPVPLAIPIPTPAPVIKPAIEPLNLNLDNDTAPAQPKLKVTDMMNNIVKNNNKVENNNMELGIAKLEFGSEGPEESVEDLTLDEEGDGEGEGVEEDGPGGAGTSKYSDIVQNFQCYMERSQDEAALSGQDGPRDSQEKTDKIVTSTPALPMKESSAAQAVDLDKLDEEFDNGKDAQIPSALLSLLTARHLQSLASIPAAAPLNVRFPVVATTTIEEKASLIQRALLQNNNILPHGCIVDVKSDLMKYDDEESDIEYDDTDDILLPEDSEMFYACSETGSVDGGESCFGGEGGERGEGCEGGKGVGDDPSRQFQCRHCGKRYRWKSTLRRHENVECGGKAPSHQCPYCAYKAKQRGNLGVHIRKHHNKEWQLYADNKLRKAKKTPA